MKKLIKYFSLTSISKDVLIYGYNFSLRTYLISIIAVLCSITLISLIFHIQPVYILCIASLGIILLPWLIRKKYTNNNRLKEFSDVDVYLHQMIYSFIRTPKIHTALTDTCAICDGKLKQLLKEALNELEYGMSECVYKDALDIIEKNYNCSRIRTLHRFLIEVETSGGSYKNALQVLLKDFDRWVKNIYQYEYELKIIKRDTTIGIFISIILSALTILSCSFLGSYSSNTTAITDNYVFQISSTIFLMLCILFYAYTQSHYGRDILNASDYDKRCAGYYDIAYNTSILKLIIKILPLILLFFAASVILLLYHHYLFAIYTIAAIVIFLIFPFFNRRTARKKVIANLRTSFSDWLRNVALNLQNKPLIASIEDSYDDCPYIIKRSLDSFIQDIEANPSDIRPYYEFLAEYNQTDIMSTVRTLYSVSELDQNGIDETINTLIQRNNELINKQTELDYKDQMSVYKFLEYIPAFLMASKLSIDMMLIISIYI